MCSQASSTISPGAVNAGTRRKYKLAIIAPTCFYYQVDLFRMLEAHPRFELAVYFCSDEALIGQDVPVLFNSSRQWVAEEDLLGGFKHKFLRNYAPWGSYLKWPFGLMNFGILKEIARERPDAVIIMGWTNLTWWLAILASKFYEIPFFYMNDAHMAGESLRPRWKRWVKQILLKRVLFRLASGFLSSGTANDQLYLHYGVPRSKIIPFAYSLVHQSVLQVSEEHRLHKDQTRAELGIADDTFVILFCGRLIKEKGPFHLLDAYHKLDMPQKALIFAGDGDARKSMELFVAQHNLESVYCLGFQNREEVLKLYGIADVVVLPSWRETWGMVVNEALCFGLPAIVSDQVGAGPDLVRHGYNGFVFHTGDADELSSQIRELMLLPEDERRSMGARSLQLIQEWSDRDLVSPLLKQLDQIVPREGAQ